MTRAPLLAGLVLGTMLGLAPAQATERFFCAASDAVADMSIDIVFDEKQALKLSHFRGVVRMKGDAAPRETRKIEIDSNVLTQYWTDGDELKFRLRVMAPSKRPTSIVDIAFDTERRDGSGDRLTGAYELVLTKIGSDGASAAGKAIRHEAAAFCAIKR